MEDTFKVNRHETSDRRVTPNALNFHKVKELIGTYEDIVKVIPIKGYVVLYKSIAGDSETIAIPMAYIPDNYIVEIEFPIKA